MSKNKLVKILALTLCFTLALTCVTLAAVNGDAEQNIQQQAAREFDTTIFVNGEKLECDVAPVIEQDRILVPLRTLAESLGAKVEWFGPQSKITVENDKCNIELIIGEQVAYVNGETVNLEVPARIVANRTLVPLRFISETLNAKVDWLPTERKIIVEPDQPTKSTGDNIKISNFLWSPKSLTITGKARVWEANLVYEVIDNNDIVLFNGYTTASAGAPEWGDFNITIDGDLSKADAIRVFVTSPKDGSRMDIVEHYVKPFGTAEVLTRETGSILVEGILDGYSNQPVQFYFGITPETIITDLNNNLLKESDLKPSDKLQIWISYPGLVLESWPAQAGAGKIVRISE